MYGPSASFTKQGYSIHGEERSNPKRYLEMTVINEKSGQIIQSPWFYKATVETFSNIPNQTYIDSQEN